MARYVDGFVIPVKKSKVKAYLKMARLGAKLWKDHGALAYAECVAEDLKPAFGGSFAKLARLKPGETVIFSYIVYRSRAHRDQVNARVMKDPRMTGPVMQGPMPIDMKRFTTAGFQALVAW